MWVPALIHLSELDRRIGTQRFEYRSDV